MDEKVVAYSREIWYKYILLKQPDGFPSGQRGQTVNLLQNPAGLISRTGSIPVAGIII